MAASTSTLAPAFLRWWAAPAPPGPPGHLLPRWLFLRSLGLIYFSAFFSLVSQIRGLLGPAGLLPARDYLEAVARSLGGLSRYWYAPTVLWFRSGDHALLALCWIGMAASLLLVFNLWPRAMLLVCLVLFLSYVTAAQDFSGYQSDGMLLSAGFISLFFAPPGLRPRWGAVHPPSRATLLLLLLVWFSIYFDSGLAKYFGGDPSWRNFTAMNQYYQNGPLPTWIGWYAAQLPQWFQSVTAGLILLVELFVVWMGFLPRRFRRVCFFIVTAMQIAIILTANYAFLNYLVLALGFLLLDDEFLLRFVPARRAAPVRENLAQARPAPAAPPLLDLSLASAPPSSTNSVPSQPPAAPAIQHWLSSLPRYASAAALWLSGFVLAWLLYAFVFLLCVQAFGFAPLPSSPIAALGPLRIANSYGLFGRMTWARYEIEFQGSNDGVHWTAYPFRFKPQDVHVAPGIYAPYQPRFDWNLWFASLGNWRNNPFVLHTEIALLDGNPDVLALFRSNPFPGAPPLQVRAVLWQYWFTTLASHRATGDWWRRKELGLYAPSLIRAPGGKIVISAFPQALPPPP